MIKTPFDENPEFYESDNRKYRIKNPVTNEVLSKKHRAIFSSYNLKGKTVLDLGSCLGASGKWALFYGAESYTGVEVQNEYAEKSRKYLTRYGDKANIICGSIEEFLKNSKNEYNVVLLLGVLHVFVNFYEILKLASSICTDILIIENLYPCLNGNIVEFSSDQKINLATDKHESMEGIGIRMSLGSLDIILATCGFLRDVNINVEPILGSKDVYNNQEFSESRYIVRYKRGDFSSTTLSEDLASNRQGKKTPWKQEEKPWVFDDTVVDNFHNIALNNIQNYQSVVDKCVQIATKICDFDSKIIDFGSALGYTLKKLNHAGFNRLYGVDASESMVNKSWKNNTTMIIHSNEFPVKEAPFHMVIANWVLHFISERASYITDIYDSLEVGGVFILSEKVSGSEMAKDLYYDFKRLNNISEEEINMKETALKGILTTKPIGWYFNVLERTGFKNIEVVDASFSFITFMARK